LTRISKDCTILFGFQSVSEEDHMASRYGTLNKTDARELSNLWWIDPSGEKVAEETVRIYRDFFDKECDEDTSYKAVQIGILIGKHIHNKRPYRFLRAFDGFMTNETRT
jgi:hypothetical protein